MILMWFDLIPDMCFHCDKVGGFPLEGITVSKNSLNWMWNWGETSPVCRLKMSTAEAALLGEGPRLIPSLVFASHLGCHPPALWKLVSLYARHPKVWSFLILGGTSTLENLLMGDITLFISGNVILSFLRWVACIAIGSVLWLSAILTYNISFYFLPDLGGPWFSPWIWCFKNVRSIRSRISYVLTHWING